MLSKCVTNCPYQLFSLQDGALGHQSEVHDRGGVLPDSHGWCTSHFSPENLGYWGHRRHGAPFYRLVAPIASCPFVACTTCLVVKTVVDMSATTSILPKDVAAGHWHCILSEPYSKAENIFATCCTSLCLCRTHGRACEVHCCRNKRWPHNGYEGFHIHMKESGMQATWLPEFLVQLLCWLMPLSIS